MDRLGELQRGNLGCPFQKHSYNQSKLRKIYCGEKRIEGQSKDVERKRGLTEEEKVQELLAQCLANSRIQVRDIVKIVTPDDLKKIISTTRVLGSTIDIKV